jgi:hypothetical protein
MRRHMKSYSSSMERQKVAEEAEFEKEEEVFINEK